MSKKSILIIILLVILLGLTGAYAIFGPNGYRVSEQGSAFFDEVINLQANLSYYVGTTYSDAFRVYTKEELLLGVTADGDKIKDNLDNVLPTLVVPETVQDYKEGAKAYQLNMDNVRTTLKIKTPDYEGITFYVVDGDLLKIKMDKEPEWWNKNYDGLILK